MIEKGFCQCGCGKRTNIAKRTRTVLGHKKGEPLAYVNGHTRQPKSVGTKEHNRRKLVKYYDNRDEILQNRREKYSLNKQKERNRARKYYLANRDKIVKQKQRRGRAVMNAYKSRWRKENRDKEREYEFKRKAKMKISSEDNVCYSNILLNDPCSYCGVVLSSTIDHIEPLSKGGFHYWENLTGACNTCNATKRANTLLLFLINEPDLRTGKGL